MDIVQSIILGLVQGLGEFLPISSTAHLVLVPFLTGWNDPGLSFDVALHAGTLIAVLAYFWKDWIEILKLAICSLKRNSVSGKKDDIMRAAHYTKNIFWFLTAATIPGALTGYFLEDYASTVFRNPIIMAFSLAFFGFILYLSDKYASQEKNISQVTLADSIIIGISQSIAIIPGVSRSGITMMAGRALGMNRVSSARFSFLMSTPIILGAMLSQLPDLINGGFDMSVAIGILVSAISGYLAIKYLIKFVQNFSYKVFFWYRMVLALVIVLVVMLK